MDNGSFSSSSFSSTPLLLLFLLLISPCSSPLSSIEVASSEASETDTAGSCWPAFQRPVQRIHRDVVGVAGKENLYHGYCASRSTACVMGCPGKGSFYKDLKSFKAFKDDLCSSEAHQFCSDLSMVQFLVDVVFRTCSDVCRQFTVRITHTISRSRSTLS